MQIIKSFSKILIRINEKQKIRDDNCSRQETQLTHTVCMVSNKWLAMCRRALVMAPLLFNFSIRLSLVWCLLVLHLPTVHKYMQPNIFVVFAKMFLKSNGIESIQKHDNIIMNELQCDFTKTHSKSCCFVCIFIQIGIFFLCCLLILFVLVGWWTVYVFRTQLEISIKHTSFV